MPAPDTFSPTALLFSRKALLAWALLVASLLGTLYAGQQVKRTIDRQIHDEISFAGDQVAASIHDRLEEYGLILRGGAGLFTGSTSVDRDEWKRFADEMDAQTIVPGVLGIGFAELIPNDELSAHTAAVRAEGFPAYEVHPVGDRDVYTSVVYLEPFSGRNLRAFGYDMYTEPTRRAAMDAARDTGVATLSGKVQLVQETSTGVQPGLLMYVAVYRSGMPTGTTAERRAALIGWAYSPYRMNDMMSGVLDGWQTAQGRYLELHIFAGDTRTTDTMLYDSTGQAAVDRLSRFGQLRTIKFNGQTWTLQFDRLGTAPSVDYAPAWWTLAAGAVFSGLLFLLVLSLRTTRENASIIARQSTRDLLDRERELQESEQRWKFAVEGAGDGLWDWNIAAGTVYYSHLWKSMLGYADEEIGSSVDAWSLRVHPDDVAATIEALDDYLTGAAPEYEREHRVRCKDGTYKWVLDRGTVMERDAGGAPLRMIGTHKDIGDRKKMEAELTAGERTVAESEARFRSLVEQSIAGTYIIQHGAFTYTNLRFKAILGYGPEDDLVGVRVVDVVAPADRAEAAERMRALSAGEKDRTEASFEAIRKDGTTVHVGTTTAKAVYKHEEALIGVLQDVSDRKVAEARIARYANQLERTFIQTVALTTTLSEKRDPYTAGHEQRVAELATAIGEAMGLDHDRIEGLRVGGYLHDVGKISVPTELLVKPTRLTPIEESLMREHPRAGYEVLKEVDFPWPVAQVALQHHERLDGSGYPSGLKGDDIILEARIVAVADVVESMVSHRPYRPALGVGAALAEVQAGAGTKFDAEVVGVCIRLFREGGFWADATV